MKSEDHKRIMAAMRGNGKSTLIKNIGDFVDILKGRDVIVKRYALITAYGGNPKAIIFDDLPEAKKDIDQEFWDGINAHKLHQHNTARAHGHPNRKPQPNRGPIGRKDWK